MVLRHQEGVPMILPLVGQRVEVLIRGESACVWYPGVGQISGVLLDAPPPFMTAWIVEGNIFEWRPARHDQDTNLQSTVFQPSP